MLPFLLCLLPPIHAPPAAPPLLAAVRAADLHRFAPPAVVEQMNALGTLLRPCLLRRLDAEPMAAWWLEPALAEADCDLAAWRWLETAWWSEPDSTEQREALEGLRAAIGPEAYGAGRMPAAFPWWALRRID